MLIDQGQGLSIILVIIKIQLDDKEWIVEFQVLFDGLDQSQFLIDVLTGI